MNAPDLEHGKALFDGLKAARPLFTPTEAPARDERLEFVLPWPPTMNLYWRHPNKGPLAGRSLISREGRRFQVEAAAALEKQRVPRRNLAGRLSVEIDLHPPTRGKRDIDNFAKVVLDVLKPRKMKVAVLAGVIEDDSLIDRLLIRRGAVEAGGCVVIRIEELGTT